MLRQPIYTYQTMGRKQEIEEAPKDRHLTKIGGQPTDEDPTKLESELLAMAASILATNRGSLHGHVGMIYNKTEFVTFLHNAEGFIIPSNPGPYPTTVDPTDVVVRARQVAEH